MQSICLNDELNMHGYHAGNRWIHVYQRTESGDHRVDIHCRHSGNHLFAQLRRLPPLRGVMPLVVGMKKAGAVGCPRANPQ